MHYHILPEALAELEDSSMWYEKQTGGLGLELLAEYQKRLDLALQMPKVGSLAGTTSKGTEIRRYRLERFKRYAILMATIEDIPTVLAFEHSSRRPGYWKERVK